MKHTLTFPNKFVSLWIYIVIIWLVVSDCIILLCVSVWTPVILVVDNWSVEGWREVIGINNYII